MSSASRVRVEGEPHAGSGSELPVIKYTEQEVKTWGVVYDKIMSLVPTHACQEYQYILPLLQQECDRECMPVSHPRLGVATPETTSRKSVTSRGSSSSAPGSPSARSAVC